MEENTHDLLDGFPGGQPRQGPSMKQVPAGTPIAQEPWVLNKCPSWLRT